MSLAISSEDLTVCDLQAPPRYSRRVTAKISGPVLDAVARSRGKAYGTTAMARRSAQTAVRDQGLFPSEAEIARRLSQTPEEWSAEAKILERHGLPRIDPIMGGRFWPAVKAYWWRRYGLSTIDISQPDGEENLDVL